MPRGGKRAGSGRKAAAQAQDAWIATAVNDLVVASVGRRFLARLRRFDSNVKATDDVMSELKSDFESLPLVERQTVSAAIAAYRGGQCNALDTPPESLRNVAHDWVFASDELWREICAERWFRRGGRRVPPLSPAEWSTIYYQVASMAAVRFGRRFTNRMVKDAMARHTGRMRLVLSAINS